MDQPIHAAPRGHQTRRRWEAVTTETRERRCPACQSEQIAPCGRIVASGGMIRVECRCGPCNNEFVFVRGARA